MEAELIELFQRKIKANERTIETLNRSNEEYRNQITELKEQLKTLRDALHMEPYRPSETLMINITISGQRGVYHAAHSIRETEVWLARDPEQMLTHAISRTSHAVTRGYFNIK